MAVTDNPRHARYGSHRWRAGRLRAVGVVALVIAAAPLAGQARGRFPVGPGMGLGPRPPSAEGLLIEALIDGDTELWVTPTGISWRSLGVAKPGRHGGRNEPTWVNGRKWMPIWGKPKEERGFDATRPYAVRVGSINLTLRLLAVGRERGAKGIERRSPVRTQRIGRTLVIMFPDKQAEPRWYLPN